MSGKYIMLEWIAACGKFNLLAAAGSGKVERIHFYLSSDIPLSDAKEKIKKKMLRAPFQIRGKKG